MWFFRKKKTPPQFSALMICHLCKQEVPFTVNQYERLTQQVVYCDRCGKMNIVAIPALSKG